MDISTRLDHLHFRVKQNKWFRYFSVFTRIALAAGFIPSGFVKISGERFTSLSVHHPMGNYLEALYHTGYYYTFIGISQLTAAILLLIPRTALLGAILYFPIILNICILSFAVRFDGSLFSSPLMLLADMYLLCWNYDKLKFIFPYYHHKPVENPVQPEVLNNKFPTAFFSGVVATIIIMALVIGNMYEIRPHNNLKDCQTQMKNSKNPEAIEKFCDCIHNQGKPLNVCLEEYNNALKKKPD